MKSAHRDIAFWHYDHPTRSTFGYHLRAAGQEARTRLLDRLSALSPGSLGHFHFDGQADNPLELTRQMHMDVTLTVGNAPAPGDEVTLAIEAEDHASLLRLLADSALRESCVTVIEPERQVPLWIWPDP